jgi:hypothetical protein
VFTSVVDESPVNHTTPCSLLLTVSEEPFSYEKVVRATQIDRRSRVTNG